MTEGGKGEVNTHFFTFRLGGRHGYEVSASLSQGTCCGQAPGVARGQNRGKSNNTSNVPGSVTSRWNQHGNRPDD